MPASRNSRTIPEVETELAEFSAVKNPSENILNRIKLLKAHIGYLRRADRKPILEKRIEEAPLVPRKRGRPRKARK